MSEVATEAKVAQLRNFAGHGVSDAELRRTLVRAAGDVNHAASILLTEKPASTLVHHAPAGAHVQPPASSALPIATALPPTGTVGTSRKRPRPAPLVEIPSPDTVRRSAWRTYYKGRYMTVKEMLGSECAPAEITARIADMWKDMGHAKREELYAKARDQIVAAASQKEAPEAQVCSPTTPTSNAKQLKLDPKPGSNLEDKEEGVKLNGLDESTGGKAEGVVNIRVARVPLAAPSASLNVNQSDSNSDDVQFVSKNENKNKNSAGAGKESSGSNDTPALIAPVQAQHGEEPLIVAENSNNDINGASWPKKFASRTALCTSSISGTNILRAGDGVTLTPSGKIVRFAFKGREIGRLPSDLAGKLAPALHSGYVDAVCRVIEVPKLLRPMKALYIDVGLRLHKHAFLSHDQVAQEFGSEDVCGRRSRPSVKSKAVVRSKAELSKGKKVTKGKFGAAHDDDAEGIDSGRVAVADLFEFLSACEPSSQAPGCPVNTRTAKDSTTDVDSAVVDASVETYFNSVRQIDSSLLEYAHPSQLTCDLREYQKIGVSWMRAREKNGSAGNPTTDAMLHPLWKRRMFPNGLEFFLNGTTGGLSLEAPLASANGPFCGILADEMGLGKTVECTILSGPVSSLRIIDLISLLTWSQTLYIHSRQSKNRYSDDCFGQVRLRFQTEF